MEHGSWLLVWQPQEALPEETEVLSRFKGSRGRGEWWMCGLLNRCKDGGVGPISSSYLLGKCFPWPAVRPGEKVRKFAPDLSMNILFRALRLRSTARS